MLSGVLLRNKVTFLKTCPLSSPVFSQVVGTPKTVPSSWARLPKATPDQGLDGRAHSHLLSVTLAPAFPGLLVFGLAVAATLFRQNLCSTRQLHPAARRAPEFGLKPS